MKRRAAMTDEVKAEYEKQLRRIKRFVRSATKRGYEFPEGSIPKHPKLVTEASIRKIKSITPDVMYKKATYTKETGEKITGLEGRKHERQQAAIKGAQTRATKAGKVYVPNAKKYAAKKMTHRPTHQWTPAREERPKQAHPQGEKPKQKSNGKKKKKSDKTPQQRYYDKSESKKGERGNAPDGSDVIISNLLDGLQILDSLESLISNWRTESNWNANLSIVKTRDKGVAKNILQNAIDQLGREQVAKNCERAGSEIIALLEEILYASGSKEGNFKDGRTQVNFDIVRFQNLLLGRTTTPEENIELVDLLDSFMYEDADEDTEQYKTGLTATTSVKTNTPYNIE